jgi:hypothetical protein
VIKSVVADGQASEAVSDGHVDDDAIVVRAQADRRAFAPLYERYLPVVYGYCRLRLPTAEAAEDATALIFTNVLTALPRYRPEPLEDFARGSSRSLTMRSPMSIGSSCAVRSRASKRRES